MDSAFPALTQDVGDPCDVLAVGKPVDRYIGKTISFYASALSTETRIDAGKAIQLTVWVCKTKDGQTVSKAQFGVVVTEATWTRSASNADRLKALFRLSGVVKERDVVRVGGYPALIPFVGKVKIELASETK